MILRPEQIKLLAMGRPCIPANVGNDESQQQDSSQKETTENQDNRIAGGNGSINLTTSRSDNNRVIINTIDGGAVSASYDFAKSIASGAANTAAASAAADQAIAKSAMQSVADAYSGVKDTLADAYTTAKAGEQKVMVGVGLAIVAIVALKALKH